MLRQVSVAVLGSLGLCAGACTDPEAIPPPCSPWAGAPSMPGRRLEAAVTAYGARLAIAGGFSTSMQEGLEVTREVIALDTFTGEYESLPELPVAWTHGALAASAGTLFLFGGLEGTGPDFIAHGEAYALGLGATEWRALPAMPPGLERGAAGVIVAPPRIYLVGGASSAGAVGTVLAFDLTTETWSQLPDLPTPRSHAAVMRQDSGTLIVAGGLALGTNIPLGDVYALPLGATAWELREPMPSPRGGCAYGDVLGRLVCAGGEAGAAALTVTETYDPVLNTWETMPEMPDARAGTQGAVIGQRLYVPGGSRTFAFEPVDSVLVFSLLDALAQ